jgi:hypothetical protein
MKNSINQHATTRTDAISGNAGDYYEYLKEYVSRMYSQNSIQEHQISHVIDGLDSLFNQKDGIGYYEKILFTLYKHNKPEYALPYAAEQERKAVDSIAKSIERCTEHSWRNWWRDSDSTWANRNRYSSQTEILNAAIANQILINDLSELEIFLGYGPEETGRFYKALRTAKFPQQTIRGMLTYGIPPFLDERSCIENISEGYEGIWASEDIASFKYHNPFSRQTVKKSVFTKTL